MCWRSNWVNLYIKTWSELLIYNMLIKNDSLAKVPYMFVGGRPARLDVVYEILQIIVPMSYPGLSSLRAIYYYSKRKVS